MLILDLRHVNKLIFREKLRFDDWRVMLEYLQTQDYFLNFTLGNATPTLRYILSL